VEVIPTPDGDIEGIERPEEPIEEPEAPSDIETLDTAASGLRTIQPISAARTPSSPRSPSPMPIVVGDDSPAMAAEAEPLPPVPSQPIRGAVVWVDVQAGHAHIHIAEKEAAIPVGTTLRVFRRTLSGDLRNVGQIEVIKSIPGGANVRGKAGTVLSRLRRGDTVVADENRHAQAATNRPTAYHPPQGTRLTLVEWLSE
jgi:hypothetical protein